MVNAIASHGRTLLPLRELRQRTTCVLKSYLRAGWCRQEKKNRTRVVPLTMDVFSLIHCSISCHNYYHWVVYSQWTLAWFVVGVVGVPCPCLQDIAFAKFRPWSIWVFPPETWSIINLKSESHLIISNLTWLETDFGDFLFLFLLWVDVLDILASCSLDAVVLWDLDHSRIFIKS